MRQSIAIDIPVESEPLVDTAVKFAANLLRFSDTFYPFGLISICGDVQNVFSEHSANSEVHSGMIEEIEWLILELGFNAPDTFSVVVYNALMESSDEQSIDVIVTKVIDQCGAETTRLFPYFFSSNQVCINKPIVF